MTRQMSLCRWNDGRTKKRKVFWLTAGRTGNKLTAYKATKEYSSYAFEESLDKVAFMVEHLLKLHLSIWLLMHPRGFPWAALRVSCDSRKCCSISVQEWGESTSNWGRRVSSRTMSTMSSKCSYLDNKNGLSVLKMTHISMLLSVAFKLSLDNPIYSVVMESN